MSNNNLRIGLVEDDPEIRSLFRMIINRAEGFSCIMVAENGRTALQDIPEFQPDLVLMDIGLPDISGIHVVALLKEKMPDLDIIMLTVQEDDESIFESLCAGAAGYLVKETRPQELLEAIREVKAGGAPMTARIARRVIGSFRQQSKENPLSQREMQVLRGLCDGENYKTLADQLFVSSNTIKGHIKNIYRKLEVNNRAAAVKKAIREGLV